MGRLTAEDLREIALLIARPWYGSRDRARDRARTRLKKRGLVFFNRATWQWVVTDEGRLALSESKEVGTNG